MADETIFPYLQPTAAGEAQTLPVLREVAWNFETDTPRLRGGVPQIVEREAAVLVWAWNALHTERFAWPSLAPTYGNETSALIGKTYQAETKRAEVQRYLQECLLASPYITAVQDVEIEAADDRLIISFSIISIYGKVRMEVLQDVGL